MATLARFTKLAVMHIVIAVTAAARHRQADIFSDRTVMTGKTIEVCMCSLQLKIRLCIMIKLP